MIHTHLHPGIILKETVFESLGLSITQVAKQIDWPRVLLSHIANGKVRLRPPLAYKLEQAGFGPARFWINLQANYDMWLAQHQPPDTVDSD
ncbi:MAG: HigA family addiction module antidote protein [Burkholderiaceae bacterium]|jgi:addiction module HigA family antidote|nr:HigA family addiction module antidote protein [Burkholderiaceae bacterium]